MSGKKRPPNDLLLDPREPLSALDDVVVKDVDLAAKLPKLLVLPIHLLTHRRTKHLQPPRQPAKLIQVPIELNFKLIITRRRLKLVPPPLRPPRLSPRLRPRGILRFAVHAVVCLVDPLARFVLLPTRVFAFGFFGVVAVEEAALFAVAFGVLVESDCRREEEERGGRGSVSGRRGGEGGNGTNR